MKVQNLLWLLVCSFYLLPMTAARSQVRFLTLPYTDTDVSLQQGWQYTDGSKHEGIDYVKGKIDRSPTWQPFTVRAAADGDARYHPGDNNGLGNYVSVKHTVENHVYYTFYCHLSVSVIPSDRSVHVDRAQELGTTGTTGAANGVNHLHFEVHDTNEAKSSRVDPYDLKSTRSDYPPNSNKSCGFNRLWLNDPPEVSVVGSRLPDGLYRASNEYTIFLVKNGFRRCFTSAACFGDWQHDASLSLEFTKTVSPEQLYSQTTADVPIAHLVKTPASDTVFWIVEDTNSIPYRENYVARPIDNINHAFERMGFKWSDVRTVDYEPAKRFPAPAGFPILSDVEPRIVISDGPYVDPYYLTLFKAGFRVRNLSEAGKTPFAVTIRIWRTDGRWMDLSWLGCNGLDKSVAGGVQHWTGTDVPIGSYTYAAVYSYWITQGSGKNQRTYNIQSVAHTSGDSPYPDNPGRGIFKSPDYTGWDPQKPAPSLSPFAGEVSWQLNRALNSPRNPVRKVR